MAQAPALPSPRRAEASAPVRLDRLAESVRRLDAPTRALLDLSVRRGVRDDAMAPILHTDPFHLAWRRARALERLATEVGEADRPAPLGDVRMALEALPRGAWGLPGAGPPALPAPGAERAVRVGEPADRAAAPEAPDSVPEPGQAPGSALVPASGGALAAPATGRLARLDAFAAGSPPLGAALRQLGRAIAAKAVRVVVWRRAAG